jgi:CBS domain-containing protein
LVDVAGFLAEHPPFRDLGPDNLARIASAVQVEYFPAGTTILAQAGEPSAFLYVVRKGAAEVLDQGRLTDLLDEGESFGHLSLVSGAEPTATIRAHEDTLCYLVPKDLAEELLRTAAGVAFLTSVVRRRLQSVSEASQVGLDMRAPVGGQVRRPPVTAPPDAAAAEAARIMTEQRVSSLLVPLGEAWGIVTDRDLRSRILAAGMSPNTPVAQFLSTPVAMVDAEAPVGEVLLAMLERGVHHFPSPGRREPWSGWSPTRTSLAWPGSRPSP